MRRGGVAQLHVRQLARRRFQRRLRGHLLHLTGKAVEQPLDRGAHTGLLPEIVQCAGKLVAIDRKTQSRAVAARAQSQYA